MIRGHLGDGTCAARRMDRAQLWSGWRHPGLRTGSADLPPESLGGLHIAERLHIRVAVSLPLPILKPTRALPVPFIARWRLGGTANRLSYQFNRPTALAYGGMIVVMLAAIPIARGSSSAIGTHMPITYSWARRGWIVDEVPQTWERR